MGLVEHVASLTLLNEGWVPRHLSFLSCQGEGASELQTRLDYMQPRILCL